MRAKAIREKGAASFEELKPACQILILHEDFAAYSRAVEVCQRIMERFSNELDFDIKCWNLIELADPNCARHAAKTAGAADLLLISLRTAQPPAELEQWLDFYFTSRFRPEGVMGLVQDPACSPLALEGFRLRLETLSERLGMDFISLSPSDDAMTINLQPIVSAMQEAVQ